MKLASHNSWSYHRPKHWYLWPFRFMARCQSIDIEGQFQKGIRMFDLRVHFSAQGHISFRHGFMTYDMNLNSLMSDLEALNRRSMTEQVIIRILLEQPRKNKHYQDRIDNHFVRFCNRLQTNFPNLKFTCGRRKFDWKKIAFLDNDIYEGQIIEKYSSVTSFFHESKHHWYAILDDFWPWLYAATHNKKLIEKYKEEDKFLMIDFV